MISLIKSGDLFAAVIENVKGICQKIKGLEVSFMDQLLEALNKEADEFSWDTVILHAKDYMLAQTLVLARKVCESFCALVFQLWTGLL